MLAVAMGMLVLFLYWIIKPYNPIEFKNEPHKILTKKVQSGDFVSYKVNYCKNEDLAPIITRTFVDGIVYTIPPAVALPKEMGCREILVHLYVPRALPTGVYYVSANYRYQVNPIRYMDIITNTEKFTIYR